MSRYDPQRDILDSAVGGHYRLCQNGGLVAAQAASPAAVFSCRWTSTTLVAIIERLRISWFQTGAFTAAGVFALSAFVERSYTVTDTGGTSVVNNTVRMATTFPASAFGDMRIANGAAAGITAGTRTQDSGVLAQTTILTSTAIGTQPTPMQQQQTVEYDPNKYPLKLAANEGLAISLNAAFPAAGSGNLIVEMDWAEVASF